MKRFVLRLNGAEWDAVADALAAVTRGHDPAFRVLVRMHEARPATKSRWRADRLFGSTLIKHNGVIGAKVKLPWESREEYENRLGSCLCRNVECKSKPHVPAAVGVVTV